ncbi:MAG: DHH family phosphoesterase [Patescibacteria group bacterium]|jgi:phosphoesterase RecJ-like protein
MEIAALSQKIYSQIKKANRLLIVCHQQPDADALGSMAAISQWLDFLGKTQVCYCQDLPPLNLAWILNFKPLTVTPDEVIKDNFDAVIILDSSDLKYAGVEKILPGLTNKPVIINIDHHATNNHFGDLNLVNPVAVSTTEIVYHLFKNLGVKLTGQMASALLAGIIYDTYNFTNPNTSYQSLETASDLLLAGASIAKVSDSILKNKTIDTLKSWGEILTKLHYNPAFDIATAVITEKDVIGNAKDSEITEGVANFLNNLTGVKAVLILQQLDAETIKGSWRTNDDLIDVSKLAKLLGGGGHKKAAGFKLKGRLQETQSGWQIV